MIGKWNAFDVCETEESYEIANLSLNVWKTTALDHKFALRWLKRPV